MDIDYAGDLLPSEAWKDLKENSDCFLVDCRTSAEWSLIGVPDLDSLGKKSFLLNGKPFQIWIKTQDFFSILQILISQKTLK